MRKIIDITLRDAVERIDNGSSSTLLYISSRPLLKYTPGYWIFISRRQQFHVFRKKIHNIVNFVNNSDGKASLHQNKSSIQRQVCSLRKYQTCGLI